MSSSRPALRRAPRPVRGGVRLAVPLLAVALLTGCSDAVTAGNGAGPGVALRVADDSVRVNEVDRAAEAVCLRALPELRSQGQVAPMKQVRQYVVRTLASRLQFEHWAEEAGLEPGAGYGDAQLQLERQADSMPADVRDEFVRVESTPAYRQDLLLAAGRAQQQAAGVAAPTDETALQAGAQLFDAWVGERLDDMEIDPRFGIALRGGSFVLEETGASYPVSDVAVAGAAVGDPELADAAYGTRLPENQRCG